MYFNGSSGLCKSTNQSVAGAIVFGSADSTAAEPGEAVRPASAEELAHFASQGP